MTSGADSGPNLLLDWQESRDSRSYWWAGIGSLLIHILVVPIVVLVATLGVPAPREGTRIYPDFRQAVHLVLPQDLTQKAPNKGKVAKEVDVEDLKPRPPTLQRLPPAPAVRAFKPPNPQATGAAASGSGAAHCRTSENRVAGYGTEYSAFATGIVRRAERPSDADSTCGAAQARV